MFSISSSGVRSGFRRRRLKRIQIHDHQIDRRDAVLRRLLAVFRFSAAEQNAAVHFRVQRLHAPAQHFRPAGQVGNVAHGDARFAQQLGRAAGRNNFDLQRGEPRANSTIPVLSNTLMSARSTAMDSSE